MPFSPPSSSLLCSLVVNISCNFCLSKNLAKFNADHSGSESVPWVFPRTHRSAPFSTGSVTVYLSPDCTAYDKGVKLSLSAVFVYLSLSLRRRYLDRTVVVQDTCCEMYKVGKRVALPFRFISRPASTRAFRPYSQLGLDAKSTARRPWSSVTWKFALHRVRNLIILVRKLLEAFDVDAAFASLSPCSKHCGFRKTLHGWK
jgi:hypothetical protein